jgi:hypothetical protein
MEVFLPTNMTVVCRLTESIDLDACAKMLTRVPVDFRIRVDKHTREKVPFFGTNGCIIGIRYKGSSSGIRVGGNQLNNCIAIDLQCCYKNIHLKLSPNKITCVGALSVEMAKESFEWILSHLRMVNDHWKHFYSLSSEVRENTLEWLLKKIQKDNDLYMFDDPIISELFGNVPNDIDYNTVRYLSMFTYDSAEAINLCHQNCENFIYKIRNFYKLGDLEEKEKIVQSICKLYKGTFEKYDPHQDLDKIWDILQYKNEESEALLNEFVIEVEIQKLKIDSPYLHFLNRIKSLLTFLPKEETSNICYTDEPKFTDIHIVNSVFNYKIGIEISLIKICNELFKRDYKVGFHNWNSRGSLIVNIPLNTIEEIDSETLSDVEIEPISEIEDIITNFLKDDKKINQGHMFQIYKKGSVRQTSPTLPNIAYRVKNMLVNDILDIVNNSDTKINI